MNRLTTARRVVVKVGSALLVDPTAGQANHAWLASMAADVARMRARGQQVLIVSSGSVALGRQRLGLGRRAPPTDPPNGGAHETPQKKPNPKREAPPK